MRKSVRCSSVAKLEEALKKEVSILVRKAAQYAAHEGSYAFGRSASLEKGAETDGNSGHDGEDGRASPRSWEGSVGGGRSRGRRRAGAGAGNADRAAGSRGGTGRSCASRRRGGTGSRSARRAGGGRGAAADGGAADDRELGIVRSAAVVGDGDHVSVRLQVLVLDRHGSQTGVVAGGPRAGHREDEATALSAVGARLAVACTGIAGGGDGWGSANVVGDLGVVVGHEVDLDGALRRVDPVDGDLRAGHPEDVASVEVACGLVHHELRVGVLVLSGLELGRHRGEGGCGENGGSSQDLCERSHLDDLVGNDRE